jgi:hypothetical protein
VGKPVAVETLQEPPLIQRVGEGARTVHQSKMLPILGFRQ